MGKKKPGSKKEKTPRKNNEVSYHLKTEEDKLILSSVTKKGETRLKEIKGGHKLAVLVGKERQEYWVEDGKIKTINDNEIAENTRILLTKKEKKLSDLFEVHQHIRKQDLKNAVRYTIGLDQEQKMVLTCTLYNTNADVLEKIKLYLPNGAKEEITLNINNKQITYSHQANASHITKSIGDRTTDYEGKEFGINSGHELLVPGDKIDLSIVDMPSYDPEKQYTMKCVLANRILTIFYADDGNKLLKSITIPLPAGHALKLGNEVYLSSGNKIMLCIANADGKIDPKSKQDITDNMFLTKKMKGSEEMTSPFTFVDVNLLQLIEKTPEAPVVHSPNTATIPTPPPAAPVTPAKVKAAPPAEMPVNIVPKITITAHPPEEKPAPLPPVVTTPPQPEPIAAPALVIDKSKLAEVFVKLLFPEDKAQKEKIFIAKPNWRNKVTTGDIMNKFIKDLSATFALNEDIIKALDNMNDEQKQTYANKILYALEHVDFDGKKGAIFVKNNGATKWQNVKEFIICAFRSLMNFDYSIMDNYFKGKAEVIVTNPEKFQEFLSKTVTSEQANTGKSKFAKAIKDIETQTIQK